MVKAHASGYVEESDQPCQAWLKHMHIYLSGCEKESDLPVKAHKDIFIWNVKENDQPCQGLLKLRQTQVSGSVKESDQLMLLV